MYTFKLDKHERYDDLMCVYESGGSTQEFKLAEVHGGGVGFEELVFLNEVHGTTVIDQAMLDAAQKWYETQTPGDTTPWCVVVDTSSEYSPKLKGAEAQAARNDPSKPEGACCNNERRGFTGGCVNCGDPCL